jgi:hypothetical protein
MAVAIRGARPVDQNDGGTFLLDLTDLDSSAGQELAASAFGHSVRRVLNERDDHAEDIAEFSNFLR